ncbi:PREDICTED: taste receptor type 1 member 3 [Myotis davidii]|uniref:taste receptor type 1 member 3 n=1 Tax=Myotis davidii TaxID=225400 RepID=UPI00076719E6|nr:PREDICTED: taste receptor type 1 member 3 [Myotis davidii]
MSSLALLGLSVLLGLGAGAPLCLSQQLRMQGDYVLGGLFPLGAAEDTGLGPRTQPNTTMCTRFSSLGLLWALAMKMAVEEINRGSALLPGLRLGHDIFDTCSEPVVAMKSSLVFMAEAGSCDIAAYCDYSRYQPRVLAVVGPHSTELALITGKLFGFFLMPQVWVASGAWLTTAQVLSLPGLAQVGTVLGFLQRGAPMSDFPSYVQARLALAADPAFCASLDAGQPDLEGHMAGPRCPAAVYSVAQALHKTLLCDALGCPPRAPVQPWQLLENMYNMSFRVRGLPLRFDANGNVDTVFKIAFLVHRQPGRHDGARSLAFAMLAYFITWVSFVPLFANMHVAYQPAVQMGTSLLCVLGILAAFHLPKCYLLLRQPAGPDYFIFF